MITLHQLRQKKDITHIYNEQNSQPFAAEQAMSRIVAYLHMSIIDRLVAAAYTFHCRLLDLYLKRQFYMEINHER